MSFGKQGKYTKEDDLKQKNTKFVKTEKPKARVPLYSTFYLPLSKSANVVFVDDVANFTEEQVDTLAECMDLALGPFTVKVHNTRRLKPWQKPGEQARWGDLFTCGREVPMTPAARIMFFRAFGLWDEIGAQCQAEPGLLQTLFCGENVDRGGVESILGKRSSYADEVIDAPLGAHFDCGLCDLAWFTNGDLDENGRKVRPFGTVVRGAKPLTFRTIIEKTSFKNRKGETISNPMKLMVIGDRDRDAIQATADFTNPRVKPSKGLTAVEVCISRGSDQKSSTIGDSRNTVGDMPLEDMAQLNPDSVFRLTRTGVINRLNADNGYRLALAQVRTGLKTAEEIADKVLSVFTEGTLVPHPADYMSILLPPTPNYIAKAFEPELKILAQMQAELDGEAPVEVAPQEVVEESDEETFGDSDIPF